MATLKIKLPANAPVDSVMQDPDLVRYAIAGTLYRKGILTGHEARLLTGDPRRIFEEKMAQCGFPLMPDDEDEILAELHAVDSICQ